MNELTMFERFAKATREFYTPAWWEPGVALSIFAALTILLIYILYTWLVEQRAPPRYRGKEMEQFQRVCNAKGLESFDEKMLLELADISGARPIHRLLLDPALFNQAVKIVERREWKKGEPRPPKVDYLRKLERRLFS